jgi:hypothetical protein
MEDSNLRDAPAPTTVFETDAFPDSANPPQLPVQGSNLGQRIQNPLCCQLHQPGLPYPYQDLNLDWTRSERAASSVGLQGLV